MASRLNPYLTFQGNAREAMEFYRDVLGGELTVMTFAEGGMPHGEGEGEKIMHAQLETPAGYTLMGSDSISGSPGEAPAGVQISLSGEAESDAELSGYYEKIAAAGTKKVIGIQRGCTALDAAGIPALATGLGFAGIAPICAALTPPGNLNDLNGLIDCLDRSIDCSIEGMARSMVPRGHEVLHHHAMQDVLDANPCVHPECGDAILDPSEECDPLLDPDQTCNADCTLVVCGDGLTQGTEECDDGNTSSGDGCSATCTDEPAACGNGVVEHFAGEVCDDNDSAAGSVSRCRTRSSAAARRAGAMGLSR